MMTVSKRFATALCVTVFAMLGNVFAQGAATLVPKTENSISYISGGVGRDEQELADAVSQYGYNVQLVFAEQTGSYLADVRVRIADSKGSIVLDTVSEGPLFMAKLPPGRYQVTAEVRGIAKAASVNASAGAKRVTLLWPATG